jgi:integrase
MARGSIVTRTTKSGEKRYDAILGVEMPDGSRKQIWKTFKLKKHAEAYLDGKSQEARSGEYFEPAKITFDAFQREWLERYPKVSETPLKDSTIKSYYLIIAKYLNPFFGQLQVSKIRVVTIEREFKATLPDDVSAKTKRNILMVLRVMLKSAVSWGYLRVNPFDDRNREYVTMPDYQKEQKGRALTPDEIRSLLDACLDDAYPVVATAVFTGMRSGEIFGLKWEDVDLQGNQIHVQRAIYWRRGEFWKDQKGYTFCRPKSRSSIRSIDMSPKLRKILLQHKLRSGPNELGLVFANRDGEPYSPENFVRLRFLPAVKNAGLGKVRFHDLRHTFGSLKIQQGENLKYVQTQMGHSSIQVTLDTYTHLLEKSNSNAASRTDDLVFGSVRNGSESANQARC